MTNTITAYPLCWPRGWRRTDPSARKAAKFGKTERGSRSYPTKRDLSIYDGVQRVFDELSRHGVHRNDVIISTNVETRMDGTPRSDRRAPDDPGVAVYWNDGGTRCMAIDQYLSVADNLAAIAATLDAMRSIERHGGAEIGRRSFDGFKALPQPAADDWRDVLGLPAGSRDRAAAEAAYKRLRGQTHPDKQGGSDTAFNRVQKAWEQAQGELS